MFNNGAQFLFFPSEMGNFRHFQQARREVIVKFTNCNLLEHELNKNRNKNTQIRAQIDEKNNIEALQNVTGSYIKKDCI